MINNSELTSKNQLITIFNLNAFSKLKDGDLTIINEIMERNQGLVVEIVTKDFKNTGIPNEELISEGNQGLYDAIKKFTLEKNVPFSSFARKCIKNKILEYLRKVKRSKGKDVSMEQVLSTDEEDGLILEDTIGISFNMTDSLEEDDTKKCIYEALKILEPLNRKIIILHDFEGKELSEIGRMIGISRSSVSKRRKKSLLLMRNYIVGKKVLEKNNKKYIEPPKTEYQYDYNKNNCIPFFANLIIKKNMTIKDIVLKYGISEEFVRRKINELEIQYYEVFLKVQEALALQSNNENDIKDIINKLLSFKGVISLIESCHQLDEITFNSMVSDLPSTQRKWVLIIEQVDNDIEEIIKLIAKRYEISLDFIIDQIKVAYTFLYDRLIDSLTYNTNERENLKQGIVIGVVISKNS